jgi:hypothetical protein
MEDEANWNGMPDDRLRRAGFIGRIVVSGERPEEIRVQPERCLVPRLRS